MKVTIIQEDNVKERPWANPAPVLRGAEECTGGGETPHLNTFPMFSWFAWCFFHFPSLSVLTAIETLQWNLLCYVDIFLDKLVSWLNR